MACEIIDLCNGFLTKLCSTLINKKVLSENKNVAWLFSPSIPFTQQYVKDIAGRQCIFWGPMAHWQFNLKNMAAKTG